MKNPTTPLRVQAAAGGQARATWLARLHRWHRISASVSLVGMLLFAASGFTLNHATQIEAHPVVVDRHARLPADLLPQVAAPSHRTGALPAKVAAWADAALNVELAGVEGDWSEDEVLVSLPRPGGDAWVRLDRATGEAEFEDTDRGWIAYLNDLHKGRHAGRAWSAFIDLFAFACVVFSATGLVILKLHAANRPATWPLVGLGLVIPLVLAILFVH